MLGIIIWAVLLVIIAACLLPWWFLPTVLIYSIIVSLCKKN